MRTDIILSRTRRGYLARAREWPDVSVEEETRDGALAGVQTRLASYLSEVEVVQVDVATDAPDSNPWLERFGQFADDPTFDDFLAEIAAYREALDRSSGVNGE